MHNSHLVLLYPSDIYITAKIGKYYTFLCIITSNAQIGLVNPKFPEHGLLANQIFTHIDELYIAVLVLIRAMLL